MLKRKEPNGNVVFISYYPLKQGLKLALQSISKELAQIYILLSIKTRIETLTHGNTSALCWQYLYPTIH